LSENLVPIELDTKIIKIQKNQAVQVVRKLFPVFPAEAITIHKSQGSTFESVAVHICKRMSNSLKYVGMSRCTKAKGLYIVGEIDFESLTNGKVPKNVSEEIKG
jgi:ATP-dependent exoDNAse (exonuclease V) alpha subunit